MSGEFATLLRSPVLGQRMFDLLYYLRWNSSEPLRLNEFAILIIGELPVVDLTTVAGTYITVAMLLATAEEVVPAGKEPPFKAGEP